ncbi:hypothetical protein SAMN05192529_11443 [Arachidicoccus rhizosphaerae]|uniref:Uncharacterized protein n=1 Tax=Arachidicoccus rhizosphaerae TaxID=551991 RepID=A0A1H4ADD3_9BACT|nr:hypothetical protein SAMN05192529_11443 [Arachidicoccus rhizosphaerae]
MKEKLNNNTRKVVFLKILSIFAVRYIVSVSKL